MEPKPLSCILRRNGKIPPLSYRPYPFDTGNGLGKKEMKEEVVRQGVYLSLLVAETMFLLCDDIRTMLWFCATLWRCIIGYQNPVLQRLLLVMHHVYSDYIKPKNGVFHDDGNSVRWRLVGDTWADFTEGIIVVHRLVMVLRREDYSYDDRVLSSAIARNKHAMKKLEDKLRSTKDFSEVMMTKGFARDTIESNVTDLWKSLFNEEAGEAAPKVMRRKILKDMFMPLLYNEVHSEMLSLPPPSLPYILGGDFATDELKEEVVQLGVELSLSVAESMFLLCDDIKSMLRFCYKLWGDARKDRKPDSPVVERLLCVIHYVYSDYIIPKKGVYRKDGESVQWRLVMAAWKDLDAGIRDLDRLVLILRGGGFGLTGREFTSRIEEALKKVDVELKPGRDVTEANGFVREAMESRILDLWKSIFDKDAKKVVKNEMLGDLFLSLSTQAPPH